MVIKDIIPKDNAILEITAEDGRSGLFDVSPYLESEAFAPLKNMREFQRVRNGKYFVEWDCGADLSADTIFAKWTSNSSPETMKSAFSGALDQPTKPPEESLGPNNSSFTGEKSYDVDIIRREFSQAYLPWNVEDDDYLRKRFLEGATISDLVSEFGRQPGGIRSRIRKLGLDS